jgi:hypothetical protein
MEDNITEEDAVFQITEKRIGDRIVKVKAGSRMWLNGIVGEISAGFGSNQDGDEYVIAVCDNCIKEKVSDGTVAHISNYMIRTDEVKEIIKENKIKWRRNNNLDQLT